MDFYAHQDAARKQTRRLVVLFALAVATLVAITNGLVAITYLYVLRGGRVVTHHYSAQGLSLGLGWQTYLSVSVVVIAVILGAIALKWLALSGGGKAVAESMGGRLIQPNATDSAQRRIINVVEEMAIASGMPVPPVYLLADESGINAFAAGNTPADAVIGITRGAIENLNRDQLQGVVAHEFSHIFNGDMRLNQRLVAVLHGILFIGLAGRSLLSDDHHACPNRTFGRGRRQTQLTMLGVGLVVVGWLGSFFGNWIKAAVSRQREFLADASAVQFTRNPEGFANALRIIGGSSVRGGVSAHRAEHYSHMFFDDALLRSSRLFATHPQLEERIKRVKPYWDGSYIYESTAFNTIADKTRAKDVSGSAASGAVHLDAIQYTVTPASAESSDDIAALNRVDSSTTDLPPVVAHVLLNAIPPRLREQCHEPLGAVAVLCGMLLSDDAVICQRQLAHIKLCEMPGLSVLAQHLRSDIAQLPPESRLPLLELCLPMLKQMSVAQYKGVKRSLLLLIRADGHIDLAEWCVFQLVCHYVEPVLGIAKPGRPQYKKADEIATDIALVLSMLAWFGHPDDAHDIVEQAFRRGADTLGLSQLSLIDAKACRMDDFGKAVSKLANSYPLLKPQLLKALAACAQHDGIVRPLEREVIHAIAAVMDCPTPPTTAERNIPTKKL